MRFARLCAMALLAAGPVAAQEGIIYSDASSQACSEEATSDTERADCIGASARQCFEATTVGNRRLTRALCLFGETEYWQQRLDDRRRDLARSFEESDIGLGTVGLTPFPKGEALDLMMQAWERYREQACQFELSIRGAMPGDDLSDVECKLLLTGAQALYLETQPIGGF